MSCFSASVTNLTVADEPSKEVSEGIFTKFTNCFCRVLNNFIFHLIIYFSVIFTLHKVVF